MKKNNIFIAINLNGFTYRRIELYEGDFKKLKPSFQLTSGNKTKQYFKKIMGMILIILGIIFIFPTFLFHFRLSATLLLIGFVIIFIINGQDTDKIINTKKINNMQLIIIIAISTLILLLITIQVELDMFIILTIISLLALKEFLDTFLSSHLQKRITILLYILFIPLVIIFAQKIINILNMYPS
ncbi:hypothetical protein AYK25_09395 [Thermoplasmatales archaeon SM1-50]|nr:MAG: hypothetical protein AYK25_09395 [Thermoplasmatales archaeon SM1-50]